MGQECQAFAEEFFHFGKDKGHKSASLSTDW
ncbi:hypothetical protein OCC_14075 [Thermococcus litoralis DSM 5473]|uniref:Uncharacterized protein n=1 Tax=Thermococcus litoralis (strain ATCC 51850 / DSM 5473 / JCM 8560 / NS-C) TaxID=523849 RepID=S6A4K6_THELN|nr:hypothetical protein OCC_14075 [Thermococcus litoralis DSM 5473]